MQESITSNDYFAHPFVLTDADSSFWAYSDCSVTVLCHNVRKAHLFLMKFGVRDTVTHNTLHSTGLGNHGICQSPHCPFMQDMECLWH